MNTYPPNIFPVPRLSDGDSMTRRQWLRAGSLAGLGLSLPELLRAESPNRRTKELETSGETFPPSRAPAKSCILFFMEGGASHIDMWDMKPKAPSNIRGIYKPIETSLPGQYVCEHLPQWSRIMHHLSIVRSVSHPIVDHNASSYFMLTGHVPFRDARLIRGPSTSNAPPYGSILAKHLPTGGSLPDYVHMPRRMFNCGDFIPGVLSGFLGDNYDPFIAGDPSDQDYQVPGLETRVREERINQRRQLLKQVDSEQRPLYSTPASKRKDLFYKKAFALITSPRARQAFRIDQEPDHVRQRYGLPQKIEGVRGGGLPHLGQCMLMARRLVEAGVRLVTIWAGNQAFDGHREHFKSLTNGLCPPTDQAFSALIEDLYDRGMLDETLVVALSEFGRTPKLGQITSSAGATPDGRDHWPNCFTIFLAGGGMQPGVVYGSSDRFGAYPQSNPVTPQDIAATIYTAMGLDPRERIEDHLNRPYTLSEGTAIQSLFS